MILTAAGREKRHAANDGPNADEYARMDDDEKDRAIEKAVIRLQNRVQELLKPLGGDGKSGKDSTGKEVKRNEED